MKLLKASALMALLLVCAILMLGVLSLRIQPVRGAKTTEINGDVNCDGKLDITDAIYILEWKFLGGPDPCAIALEPGILDRLNALGDKVTALQTSLNSLADRVPSPANIVAIERKLDYPAQGGSVLIYEVPDNYWFVLTSIGGLRGGGVPYIKAIDGQSDMKIVGNYQSGVWSTGQAFPPGTKFFGEYGQYYTPPAPYSFYVFMNGYLAGE